MSNNEVNNDKDIYTVTELARILNVSRQHILKLIKEDKLPSNIRVIEKKNNKYLLSYCSTR